MIYPGEMQVNIALDPEATGCSDVTADEMSCTATITSNDMYTVSLTVTNDLDSVMTMMAFDCEFYIRWINTYKRLMQSPIIYSQFATGNPYTQHDFITFVYTSNSFYIYNHVTLQDTNM